MYSLILVSLVVSGSPSSEATLTESRMISVGGGLLSAHQVDRGYSPLIFSGRQGSANATYSKLRGHRERVWALEYSSGTLQNRHGRNLECWSLSWLGLFLYQPHEESPFSWGWSNSNNINRRTIDDFLNYTGRTDYFTSFGPAAKYSLSFGFGKHELTFQVLGHLQLLGFYIPSSHVSSMPRGFGYEQNGFGNAVLNSAFLFHPGSAINFGLRPGLKLKLGENNSVGLSYLYDYSSLSHVHSSQRSRGSLGLSLTMGI